MKAPAANFEMAGTPEMWAEVDRLRAQTASLPDITTLATEWRDARRAFLALPPNDPTARAALDRFANAEHALMKGPN